MFCLGNSGAMEYERDPLHCGGKRFGPCAVALCKSHIHMVKPAQLPEIPHQAGYGITVPEKPFNKMTPYKAGSSRDQCPSLRHLLSPCNVHAQSLARLIGKVKMRPALRIEFAVVDDCYRVAFHNNSHPTKVSPAETFSSV